MRFPNLALAVTLAALAACQSTPAAEKTTAAALVTGKTYGAPLTAAGALPMSELSKALGEQDSAQVKLVGKASGVCQAKGCWLTMATPDGRQMRVRFKDYAFFVPKDLKDKTIVINGWAHREEVPVSDLQHYAKDAGKPAQEIAAITKPEEQLNFEADGVLVQE